MTHFYAFFNLHKKEYSYLLSVQKDAESSPLYFVTPLKVGVAEYLILLFCIKLMTWTRSNTFDNTQILKMLLMLL